MNDFYYNYCTFRFVLAFDTLYLCGFDVDSSVFGFDLGESALGSSGFVFDSNEIEVDGTDEFAVDSNGTGGFEVDSNGNGEFEVDLNGIDDFVIGLD